MPLSLLDIIFPKYCVGCRKIGSYLCQNCTKKVEFVDKPVCPVCQRQAVGGRTHPGCKNRYSLDGLVIACRYRGPVKDAIKSVKYKWHFDVAKLLSGFLASNLWRFQIDEGLIMVPVPLHSKRKRWRGFNQAEKLAEVLSRDFSQKYFAVLERKRETKAQVGLDKKERKANMKGAFSIKDGVDFNAIGGRVFLLVDDVYTSGATMAECAKVLKRAGAKKVWGMAVALG